MTPESYHAARLRKFEREPPPAQATVLLGDSLSEGFAQTGLLRVINRGINGDKIAGVAARLSERLLAIDPARILLLVGINDLGDAPDGAERVFAEYAQLVGSVSACFPHAALLLQTWLPVQRPYAHLMPGISAFNQRLGSLGAPVIDVHAALRDSAGSLRAAYSRDGLHLSHEGYARWAECLRPYLPASDFEEVAWKRLLARVARRSFGASRP